MAGALLDEPLAAQSVPAISCEPVRYDNASCPAVSCDVRLHDNTEPLLALPCPQARLTWGPLPCRCPFHLEAAGAQC